MTEDGKVAMRNVRRDFVEKIKQSEKDKAIGKDDSKSYQVSHFFLSSSSLSVCLTFNS
jgi:ribosome recycling factor